MRGDSKAVWNFSKNSIDLVAGPFSLTVMTTRAPMVLKRATARIWRFQFQQLTFQVPYRTFDVPSFLRSIVEIFSFSVIFSSFSIFLFLLLQKIHFLLQTSYPFPSLFFSPPKKYFLPRNTMHYKIQEIKVFDRPPPPIFYDLVLRFCLCLTFDSYFHEYLRKYDNNLVTVRSLPSLRCSSLTP